MISVSRATTFSVAAIASAVADRVRETLEDGFGNTLEVWESDPVPCRHCLQITASGEPVILFAYRPFDSSGPYAEIGPVFVHARRCERYADTRIFPQDFRERVLTMRGYNAAGRIETAELSAPGRPEESIARLFTNERVRFIHVRNPSWGCYDFRVDRSA
jgi:Protein of unknown function (DUF1203)